MSFGPLLDRLHRSLAVRLSLWFALVFLVSATALFFGLYTMLARRLEVRTQELLDARLLRYARIYETQGTAALALAVKADENLPGVTSFFIRLSRNGAQVIYVRVPPEWLAVKFRAVPRPDDDGVTVERTTVLRIPQDADRDIQIAVRELPDGTVLEVGRSTDSRTVLLAPVRQGFLTMASVMVVLSFLAGVIFAWRATRPIREIARTARAIIRGGSLSTRVPVPPGEDELAELARHFNTVLDKNESLIRAMRESLDNVAHDLRTPLTSLRGTAELALQAPEDSGQAREALADCVEESERVLRILSTLMDVAEAEAGVMKLQRETVDLAGLLREVVELYSFVAEERKIQVDLTAPGPCEASVDPSRLRQVLANLLDNALKYTPAGGRVTLGAATEDGAAIVRVRDSGMGIAPEEQPKIWGRLYRGDRSRSQRGLGLGLSLVKAIVEAHSGTVTVQSAVGQGSEFTLRLPGAAPAVVRPVSPPMPAG